MNECSSRSRFSRTSDGTKCVRYVPESRWAENAGQSEGAHYALLERV